MDFSAPYRVITPTLEGPILGALAGAELALTRQQIVALVEDASEAGVRKALARLVEQGIVIEQRYGRRYAYLANREHLLWPSVEALFSARRLLRTRVEALVAQWEFPPASVELFGSVARGGSDATSDIDLLIVRPDLPADAEEVWDRQVGELHDQIVRWTGNACDIVVLDPADLGAAHEQDEPILQPPTSTLAGTPLAALLAQSVGEWAEVAAVAAARTQMQLQLKALSEQTFAIVEAQQQAQKVVAAISAQSWEAAQITAGFHADWDSLRPAILMDTSGLQAAARAISRMSAQAGAVNATRQ
jgi:predicted nucleotidyltransferase